MLCKLNHSTVLSFLELHDVCCTMYTQTIWVYSAKHYTYTFMLPFFIVIPASPSYIYIRTHIHVCMYT